VQGYKETHNPRDEEAINKLFERDKEALRESGVQVEVYIANEDMEDNQESRYRIPNESFIWPNHVKNLTGRQIALLNVAAQVWAQASLSKDAEIAMTRLRALGEIPEDSGLVGIAPRIRTHHRSFGQLNDAITRLDVVSFDYRKAGSSHIETRTVEPWAMQNVRGQWLLVCFDQEKGQPRNFLLQRIVSQKIARTGDKFNPPAKSDVEAAMADLSELIEQNLATLRVARDSEAWFHFEMDIGVQAQTGEIDLNYMDLNLLADELREYALDIEVVRPTELREAIRAGFEKVANSHHD
jgi:proteasome accessory factor B